MKKKLKEAHSSLIDEEEEKAIIEYADAAVEALDAEQQREDPFDQYTHQVRSKVHSNLGEFHNKFLRGYQALLEKLRDMS